MVIYITALWEAWTQEACFHYGTQTTNSAGIWENKQTCCLLSVTWRVLWKSMLYIIIWSPTHLIWCIVHRGEWLMDIKLLIHFIPARTHKGVHFPNEPQQQKPKLLLHIQRWDVWVIIGGHKMRSGVQELVLVGLKSRNSSIQYHGFSCFQHPVFRIQMTIQHQWAITSEPFLDCKHHNQQSTDTELSADQQIQGSSTFSGQGPIISWFTGQRPPPPRTYIM